MREHHDKHPHEEIEIARQKNPPGIDNGDGTFTCGIDGCLKTFQRGTANKHYESVFHKNTLLFVYLPHHLQVVFKTDIIIPVNAHISDAKTNLFVR